MHDPTPEEVAQIQALLLEQEIPSLSTPRGSVRVRRDPLPIEEKEDAIRSAIENSIPNSAQISGSSLSPHQHIQLEELRDFLTRHATEADPLEVPTSPDPKWESLSSLRAKRGEHLRSAFERAGKLSEGLGQPTEIEEEPDWVGDYLDGKGEPIPGLWPEVPDGDISQPSDCPPAQPRAVCENGTITWRTPAQQAFIVKHDGITPIPKAPEDKWTFNVGSTPLEREAVVTGATNAGRTNIPNRVGSVQEFAQRRRESERKSLSKDHVSRYPAPDWSMELIEYATPDGKAFYMPSPETKKRLRAQDARMGNLEGWEEGPLWSAIHKMTGWPKERIQGLEIRVRTIPPI